MCHLKKVNARGGNKQDAFSLTNGVGAFSLTNGVGAFSLTNGVGAFSLTQEFPKRKQFVEMGHRN